MRRSITLILGLITMIASFSDRAAARSASLLPTQQRIESRGKEIDLGLFPTGIALSSDGRFALVTNNGFINHTLTAVDTESLSTLSLPVGLDTLFIGVAMSPDGRTGYASERTTSGGAIIRTASIGPGPTMTYGPTIPLPDGSFLAGMAVSPDADGTRLYVAENLLDRLGIVDTKAKKLIGEVAVGRMPWGVAVHPSLPRVYVSNRADDTLSIVDTEHMTVVRDPVPTGKGPNAVAVSPDGAKVFVANATSDDVTVFDVDAPDKPRRISLSPFEDARPGSSPNALAFSPDGSRLYVANAWDNDLAVISPDTETVLGLIPTGWYPSAIAVSPDNRTLYIVNMKGARTYARTPAREKLDFLYNIQLGGTYGVKGTLQVLPVPSDLELGYLTSRVRYNNGFDTGHRPSNAAFPSEPCFPIPCNPGDITPIKHVVFIVRENKTYDQELSDLPQGDGVSNFLLYGQTITPNLHKLVEEFVLMDRFFADSEKSEPGHAWTTASIDSDYEEKTWVAATNDRRPNDIGVQDPSNPGFVLPVAEPAGLYWFDNCYNHEVSFRNYGEFLRADDTGTPIGYWVDNTDANYRHFDLSYSDLDRFDEWKQEFDQQVLANTFPQFTYITLPNDHTNGTGHNVRDPRSYVAENDLATGRVIEAISNSPYWTETVIFLLEDDPQSGGDHVDSHRTVGTVIGPYVRRHYVSHTRFDMASMHRTAELILGLPPMSQFDQMANPMRELFTDTPDSTPYTALENTYPLFVMTRSNRGAALSARQDWSAPDRVPDEVLNKLLWDYLKGPGARP
jgi:YVTN family beta-propeller protein